jgi:peptidoglycan/LPS O-acetylase OafA/YrhL
MHQERIPELDGVRGLAIISVFIYHIVLKGVELNLSPLLITFQKITDTGWAGVDLFFVLSGFLITSILLETRQREKYFVNFYGRRVLRIFPVYYIALTIIFLVSDPAAYQGIASFVVAFYLYLQNWMLSFGAFALPDRLGHYWSLAIEEQFYLVWPFIVRKVEPHKLMWICLAAVTASPLLRFFIVQASGNIESVQFFLFASTVTRFDGLTLGALVAVLFHLNLWRVEWMKPTRIVFTLSSIAALLVLYRVPGASLWFNVPTLTIGFTFIALTGASLIILLLCSEESSLLRKIFRNPILLFCGKYSYALYVFHWPLIALCMWLVLQTGLSGLLAWGAGGVSVLIASIVSARLSWELVEKNALRLKRYFAR